MSDQKNLKNLTFEEISALVQRLGQKPFRARQIYSWLFNKGAKTIDSMTDISLEFRETLKREGWHIAHLKVVEIKTSRDGTKKLLLECQDSSRLESVLIPGKARLTLCVSTQTGCAMACKFCMTGVGRSGRNLTLSELLGEVHIAMELVEGGSIKGHSHIANIVLMGMGEPLNNYEEVSKFLKILTDPLGMGFSSRKITLSTAGIIPAIKRLAIDSDVNLAVSLNATTDEVRSYLMPINKKYPLKELLTVLKSYPLKNRRHITFEYVLIKGINDTIEDARRLVGLIKGIPCKINLIPFNVFPGCEFERPSPDAVETFGKVLLDADYTVNIRLGKGADIQASCGQLRGGCVS